CHRRAATRFRSSWFTSGHGRSTSADATCRLVSRFFFSSRRRHTRSKRDWSSDVCSSDLRQWFSKERREEAIENGREQLARAMRRHQLSAERLMSAEGLLRVSEELRLPDVSAVYAAIGNGTSSAAHVVDLLAKATGAEDEKPVVLGPQHRTGRSSGHHSTAGGVRVKGSDGLLIKLARCCTPVPGDAIVGFVTRGAGVSVHRDDCSNLESMRTQPERFVEVEWTGRTRGLYLVNIQVEALDRSGLLSDITRVLSELHVNILSASVATSRARVAQSRFVFELGDGTHLDNVLATVRRVEGVFDAYRVSV